MAVIQTSKTVQPTTINKFLGLNLSNTGDTQIQLGESGNMTNFYITDDLKLRKMYGYKCFHQFTNPIRGVFSAKIEDTPYLLVASGNKIYYFSGDALDSNFEVNPKKYQSFNGDGTTTTFQLSKDNIESVDEVKINGMKVREENEEVDPEEESKYLQDIYYTSDLVNGEITISEAPEDGTFIIINYTKEIEFKATENNITNSNNPVSFFEFDNYVYILCDEYYKFYKPTNGDPDVQLVEGYIPTVFINTPAGSNGGGVIYDEINMLTSKKRQTFNGDGNTHEFKIAQIPESIISVEVWNGSAWNSAAYTAVSDVITITDAPDQGQDNVRITWSKNDNDRTIITGMKFGTVFGGDVDTRVFLYGNPNCKNRVYYSAIEYGNDVAVPGVEYFPATAQVDIGPSNFAVTDLTRQYDRLLATTNKPEAYYLTLSTEQLPVTLADNSSSTRYVPSVATLPLNEAHGNVAMGQGQLLMNYPVTFEDGAIIQWKATNVRDEKNADIISQKIKLDLDKIPMSGIKSLDLQERNQLWVSYGDTIWIYNYYSQTYSRIKLPDTVENITSLKGDVYISTSNRKMMKFNESFTDYDGETIEAYWEMNFSDFGVPYLRKTMNRLWVSMQPQNWSSADISFISNVAESVLKKHIEYKKQWFDNVNFGDWHFTSSINPQPFKIKLKAKKFTNLKITIKNEENSTCTILSLVLQVESFGYSK